MDCTIRVAKTKALISFAVTAICVFVFAYAKSRVSHDEAHICHPVGLLIMCLIYGIGTAETLNAQDGLCC